MSDTAASINEYLSSIENIRKKGEVNNISFPLTNMFFRGHADEGWELKPALYRDRNLKSHEKDILIEAQRRCWSFLKEDMTPLEKMIRLQHHGLATRLLDLTSNPLIALFFAVCDNDDKDGKVFVFQCQNEINDDLRAAKVYAELLFEYYDFQYDGLDTNRVKECINRLGYNPNEIDLTRDLFFYAPFNNDRIIMQRGAFLLPSLFKENIQQLFCKEAKSLDLGSAQRDIIICKDSKKAIRKELQKLGVDESMVYPDFQHTLKAINTYYKDINEIEGVEL